MAESEAPVSERMRPLLLGSLAGIAAQLMIWLSIYVPALLRDRWAIADLLSMQAHADMWQEGMPATWQYILLYFLTFLTFWMSAAYRHSDGRRSVLLIMLSISYMLGYVSFIPHGQY